MKKAIPIICLLCYLPLILCSQNTAQKKQLQAIRIVDAPTVDGNLNEVDWQNAPIATDFIQDSPNPGEPAPQKTEVRVLYDDVALYIGAICHDSDPQNIVRDLSQRDNAPNTDLFGIAIDAYQDGVNGTNFIITAAGVQMDAKLSSNNDDYNWNAVWTSEVQITDEGWVIECKIPFSALRFPNKEVQKWNINFGRNIRKTRTGMWWSPIDPEVNGFFNQAGELVGIENVESPVRLFLYPYVSGIVEHYLDREGDNSTGTRFAGGMDIKYGLNDAFTLDMTLVPDFTQVRSDNQVLNLSPFEIQFDENRQFFTEGTELFSKGGLFYSRRIGGTPLKHYDIDIDEDVDSMISNPSTSRLLNATKISGRNKKKLGIGFFNAIVGKSHAIVFNKESQEEREIETNPLTNYNILVFDQALKNNSYISLINTNVLRIGEDYDANVTGTEFELRNKTNKYAVAGNASVSQLYNDGFKDPDLGFKYKVSVGKIDGNFNMWFNYNVESDTYDRNDLGFLFNNNERSANIEMAYNIFKPFWKLNRFRTNAYIGYERLYNPNTFANFVMSQSVFMVWKNFFANGMFFTTEPINTFDYFEPRVSGRYYAFPINNNVGGWISTDYRKPFAIDVNTNYRWYQEDGRYRFNLNVSPRVRVNDRLLIVHNIGRYDYRNDVGFVDKSNDDQDIIFGIRDLLTIENTFNATYIFTNRMGLTFRLRHYWSEADYNDHRLLSEQGELLTEIPDYFDVWESPEASTYDQNYNAFTIDLNYRWQFLPGSELNLTWKNAIFTGDEETDFTYLQNLDRTFGSSQSNSISLKVLWFIDYLSLKKKG